MHLSMIAIKNLKQNFSFYSLYLFSVSFVLMIFFCFTSFSNNEIIMEKISSDGRVETMCRIVSGFLMSFVIFYMFYSNQFFLRRRMKELGIYALLGYRKSAILELLIFENIWICSGSLIIGIAAGSLLHKGITAGIISLLGLSIDNRKIPFISWNSVKSNIVFILVVLLTLILSNARLLRKSTLLDLVKLEKKVEKPISPNAIAAICGILWLAGGYTLAFNIRRGKASVWYTIGFSPIALLTLISVIIGTILSIDSFLPFFCQQIKRHKKIFYRENTIIVVPKFMHHIRSNAKSLILLILLSAGTIAIFGATILSLWYPFQTFQRIIPSAIEYRVSDKQQRDFSLQTLTNTLGKNNFLFYETTIIKISAASDQLPPEYHLSEEKGRVPCFECISQNDYQTLLAQQGKESTLPKLSNTECVLIKYHPDDKQSDLNVVYHLEIEDSENSDNSNNSDVTVVQTTLDNPIGFSNSVGTLVVSNQLYQQMLKSTSEKISVISINGSNMRSNQTAYEVLKQIMPDNLYLASAYQRETEFIHLSSSTFLLISFATVIFFIATGSILYFQNISSVTYDKPDYKIMQKMGYHPAMIKKCVRQQIQIVYLIPYIIGLLHSIFAIICYKEALMDDLLGRSSAVIVPVLFAVILFTAIYGIYYQITKYSCYKIVLH